MTNLAQVDLKNDFKNRLHPSCLHWHHLHVPFLRQQSSRSSGLPSLTPQCTGVFWVISMQMRISMQDHTAAFNSPAEELILLEGMLFHLGMPVRLWTQKVNSLSQQPVRKPEVRQVKQRVKMSGPWLVFQLQGAGKREVPQRILTLIENSALPLPKIVF